VLSQSALVDIECFLVHRFNWRLMDIDETDMESLIPFVMQYPTWLESLSGKESGAQGQLFADQAEL
jgi:hypothetical protein